jgi:hypothetical protein
VFYRTLLLDLHKDKANASAVHTNPFFLLLNIFDKESVFLEEEDLELKFLKIFDKIVLGNQIKKTQKKIYIF